MDETIKQVFLNLLRAGLWETSPQSQHYFPLTEIQWEEIYAIAVAQTVEGLVYEGWLQLPKDHFPPKEIQLKWVVRVDGIERHNLKIHKTLSLLSREMQKNGIEFYLLKGLGLAENYIKPLQRISGDIDLYFDTKEAFHKANAIIQSKGVLVKEGDLNSVYFHINQCEIEHHSRMIDIQNPFCQRLIKQLIKQESDHKMVYTFNHEEINTPSSTLTYVQANAHILKHFLGFGLGLRQFCDIARLYGTKSNDVDADRIKLLYAKFGIFKWMDVMHNFLVDQLGLNDEFLPYPPQKKYDTNWLMNDILETGNFGFHDLRYQPKGNSRIEPKRDRGHVTQRVMPHLLKGIQLAPYETFWYPIVKVRDKIFRSK